MKQIVVLDTAEKIFAEQGERTQAQVGTMIEIPRACMVADEIAREADFFSFGTNDLTQMGFGFSRDDAGKYLESYFKNRILEAWIPSRAWTRKASASWLKRL